jgi:hypothetical protein
VSAGALPIGGRGPRARTPGSYPSLPGVTGARALDFLALGTLLGLVAALVPGDVTVALAVVAPPTAATALWIGALGDTQERRFLGPIFLAAVAVRIAVALVVAYAAPGYFALDDQRYAALGSQVAEHWAGAGPFPEELYGRRGYYVWNALLYTLVGFVPLAPTLWNALLGGIAVVLAYRIARSLGGDAAARVAALLTAFFPSLVLWSSLNLKDAAAIVAILVALRGAQRLGRRASLSALAMLALGIAFLAELRGYLALVLGGSMALAFVLPRLAGPRAPVAFATLVAVGVLAMGALGPIEGLADDASLESLDRARRDLAFGASAYHGDADVATVGGALRFLPLGLAYFLFAPAPWQVWNARQVLTLPEMLAWYALLPQVAIGITVALRRQLRAALPVASFALFATISYALAESNLGTAYRHRAQVLVLFLVFAAVGVAERRARRSERAARAAARRGVA